MGDLFPTTFSLSIENLRACNDLEQCTFSFFRIRLRQDQVYFEHLPFFENLRNVDSHFKFLRKKAILPLERLDDIDWKKVHKRLFAPDADSDINRKNLETTMFFCTDHKFLVKSLFTFGFRSTGELCHVYQTQAKPLLFYRAFTPEPERSFKKDDQEFFECFVLQEHSVYVVPPKTTYLILTVAKTFFAVHLMRPSDAQCIKDYQSPFHTTLTQYRVQGLAVESHPSGVIKSS